MEKKKYHVVIHIEGGVSYDIDAEDKDTAEEIAMELFERNPIGNMDIIKDWFVCDSWESK